MINYTNTTEVKIVIILKLAFYIIIIINTVIQILFPFPVHVHYRSRPVVTVFVEMRVDGTTPVALNSTYVHACTDRLLSACM